MKILRFSILLLFLFAAGCSHPVVTPPQAPVDQVSQAPVSTASPSPENISGPFKSSYWTPTAFVTVTAQPTNTPQPSDTPAILNTPPAPGFALLESKEHMDIHRSPNGKWFWSTTGAAQIDGQSKVIFFKTIFASRDGTKYWEIWPQAKDISDVETFGAYYMPVFWLPDEPYVFVTGTECCSDGFPAGDPGMNLGRLNLETGQFNMQFPGWQRHEFMFAEDGKYLLETQYARPYWRFIRLYDWKTIDIPAASAYRPVDYAIFFSKQNKAVIPVCQLENSESWNCKANGLILVDLASETYNVIVPDLAKSLGVEDNYLSMALEMGYLGYEKINGEQIKISWKEPETTHGPWFLDINSGNITPLP